MKPPTPAQHVAALEAQLARQEGDFAKQRDARCTFHVANAVLSHLQQQSERKP